MVGDGISRQGGTMVPGVIVPRFPRSRPAGCFEIALQNLLQAKKSNFGEFWV